jgi:hypothetical protein
MDKFVGFLDSLKSGGNVALIESIKQGYAVLVEGDGNDIRKAKTVYVDSFESMYKVVKFLLATGFMTIEDSGETDVGGNPVCDHFMKNGKVIGMHDAFYFWINYNGIHVEVMQNHPNLNKIQPTQIEEIMDRLIGLTA